MMSLGYFLKLVGLIDAAFIKKANAIIFKVLLPSLLFINIYNSNFKELFSFKLVAFAVISVVIFFLALFVIIPKIEKDNKNRGVMIQGIFRSNYILFGIPVAANLYGSENTGTTAILVAFVVPTFNLLSVVALSYYGKKGNDSTVKEIIKNPLIIGSVISFFFVATGIKLPIIFTDTIAEIASIATPLALIILGAGFEFKNIAMYKRALIISVTGKLVLMPMVFVGIAILVGFRGMELVALMAMFASPTAVSSFTMAQNARANDELAGQIVVCSSILAVFTIFVWVTVLNYFALI